MGKFVGAIIGATLTAVGVVTMNPALIAAGTSVLSQAVSSIFAPSVPKSEAGETQKKEPMPVRSRGIGTRRVYGKSMLFDTAEGMTLPFGGSTGGVSVDVLAYLDQRCHAVRQVYLNDDKVTLVDGVVQELDDGRYTTGKVKAGFNLGLPTETAFADVVNAMPGIWTENHRGDGITSGFLLKAPVKDKNFLKCYPQGDNVILSAVFDMAYLFDPRDETMDPYDPETWVVESPNLDNPALGLLWYLLTDRGVDYDTKILPVIDYWIAAADHCDELVATKSGTEKRYRCCILYDLNVEPANVIQEILKTFDGWLSQDELGRWIVYSGQYYAPTVTIGPEHILDARHQGFVEEEDFYNNINVSYISAEHDYVQVPADPWRDDADIAARGRENSTDFNPQVPSHSQARRLTKRQAQRQNANDRGTLTLNYGGRVALGQRYIWLNHVEAGTTFYTGPAEIVTSPERDMQVGSITFDWVAADPDVDDWNPATEEGEPAPVGNRVPLATLSAPVISSAVPQYSDDGVSALIAVEVDAEDREDLTWFGRWKRTSDVVWTEQEYSDIDGSALVELLIGTVPLESVDVAVAYQVGDGRVSPWSATETVDASAVIAAPSGVSGTGGTGSALVEWTNGASPQLSYSRVYRNTSDTMTGATQVSGDEPSASGAAQSFSDTVAAGTYYYFVRGFSGGGAQTTAIGTGAVTVS